MMADDNQSSPSSITIETKPALEEGKEEVVTTANSESETKSEEKLPNGSAKTIENNNAEDTNANHIHLEEAKKDEDAEHATVTNGETDHDNNCADSLEGDHVEDYIEEKTYTSETSFVMKSEVIHEVKTEEIVQTSTVEEHTSEKVHETKVAEAEIPSEDVAHDSIDGTSTVEETVMSTTSSVEQVSVTESKKVSEKVDEESKTNENNDSVSEEVAPHEEQLKESVENKVIPALEIPDCTDEDGFVRIGECLPIGDNVEDIHDVLTGSAEREGFEDEHKNGLANGHDDLPSSPSLPPTPDSALGDKIEPEAMVKSLKRAHVNKTEQPYSSCTTETKIAMEIREMREREEELRIMRERAVISPVPNAKSPAPKEVQTPSPTPSKEQSPSPLPNGCGYRVSSVFGHKGTTSPAPSVVAEEERKAVFGGKGFTKESAVEKEIRIAREREEELRNQKGLPPREDDSYVKPSQVKSSQVRVFGPVVGANNVKQAATAKIQLEIEEQTQREMALRDTGSIQTISQERTDAKVAKLKTAEVTKTLPLNGTNGHNGHSHSTNGNGAYTNGRSSPDVAAPYKRGSPSPINLSRPASIFSQSNGGGAKTTISMHKFISSKGKEATFAAPLKNGGVVKEEPKGVMPPNMIKLKRTVSVESKIQQEIMEMKQREEELKLLHMNRSNDNLNDEDIMEHEMNQKNNFVDYGNGNGVNEEDISPRHNKLIAQWEQRIQKAES